MLKKISVVFCAGLMAAAFAAGCKKDKDGAGGGDCGALGKRLESQMTKEMGDLPAEAKAMAEKQAKPMIAAVVTSCKEDKWTKEAIDCGLTAEDPATDCEGKITKEQMAKMEERMMKAMGDLGDMFALPKEDDDKPAGGGEVAGGGGGGASGVPECDDYVAAVEKYLACDKVPQEVRDGTKDALEMMRSGWGDAGALPAEAKQAMADGCKQATDAIQQGASAMGC
jgi:hypothetical protein